ncbi:MAG: hypothetical protein M1480_15365 [Bacteroidetes bacterium]|nr:hypothetical protein [Bacteroidota bacterium]
MLILYYLKSEINNPRWLYNSVNNIGYGGSIGFGVETKLSEPDLELNIV